MRGGVWQKIQQKIPETEIEENSVRVKKTSTYQTRRITSEAALEKVLPWHFEKGVSYHCLSWGDVDSLTYLRVIVKQQRLEYALISTWCMSQADIKEIFNWVDAGYIKRVDFFVGEIFKGSYAEEYSLLTELCTKYKCRLVIFRNHSKIMLAFGEKFDVCIESSANVNTNPRTEQTVITIDSDLANWYKEIFDEITPFNQDFVQPKIFKLGSIENGKTEKNS